MSHVKPVNKLLVTIPKAFEDELVTDSGFKLWKDPSYSKEWNASIVGTVSALSDLVSDQNKPIYDELDLGMTVAMDYKIVADFDYVSDENHFHPVTPDESIHLRKYVSKSGNWINVRSIPNPKGVVANRIFSVSGEPIKAVQEKTWIGWLQNKYMDILDSVQGTEYDLEKWLSQFSFGKTDAYTFRNKVYVDKQPMWVAEFEQIIAKKVQGEWVALNGYVICAPLVVDLSQKVSISNGGIHIPESAIQLKFRDRAIILNGGEDMGIEKHSVIAFQEKYLYPNIIEGVEYFFIKKSHIDGLYPVN